MTDPQILRKLEAQRAYARARAQTISIARRCPEVFMRLCLKDERTGKPVKMSATHDAWHSMLGASPRVVMWSHVEGGKTSQISIGRVVWELGNDPTIRIAILAKTQEMAKKIVRSIAQYIERDPDVRAVFPHLKPAADQSLPWSSTAITVERPTTAKDPSVQATGAFGSILGSRIDLLIIDDLLDYMNTRTEAQREEVWNWMQSTAMGRLTENARVWAIGNAWHPRDSMHKLAAIESYTVARFPVVDPVSQKSTWPERWPLSRISAFKADLGPLEFSRQLLCMARDDGEARFRQEWIDVCLRKGRGYRLMHSIRDYELPEGFVCITGVDLAVQKHDAADLTVFFTVLLHPDGTRQILNVESGRWAGPEIVQKLDEIHERFGGLILVENVGAQDYILQFAKQVTHANIRPFTTGKNKVHPEFGVESIGAELAAGKWLIPNKANKTAPEIDKWISEMLYYSPKDHTGDRLMASWFAREGARRFEVYRTRNERGGDVGIRVVGNGPPQPPPAVAAD